MYLAIGIVEQEVAFLEQHHDADGDDRLGHGEDAEQGVVRHRRGPAGILPAERLEPADLTAAGDHHGHARRGSLVDVALERVRHPLQPDRREPEQFRFGLGEGRGLRGGGVSGGGLRGHGVSPSCSCCWPDRYHRGRPSLAQNTWLEQGRLNRALTASPLQSGLGLCLKRRISGDAWFRRGVAQLVEYRSPKPVVAGSSPAAPASSRTYLDLSPCPQYIAAPAAGPL